MARGGVGWRLLDVVVGQTPPLGNIRPAGLTTFRSDSVSRPGPYAAPPGAKSSEGRPTRGNSRIEGTRPVRSSLRPPPSRPANLYRDETRAGFPYSFRGFAEVGCNTRRAGSAERAAFPVPVSDLDFRGERLRRRLPRGCSVYATVAADGLSVLGDPEKAAAIELLEPLTLIQGSAVSVASSSVSSSLCLRRSRSTVTAPVSSTSS